MDIEIVLDQGDRLGVGEVDIGEVLEGAGVVDGRVAIGDFHVSPAFQRRKHHEQIGRSIALVFVVEAGFAALLHLDRHASFADQLLGGLIQTDQRTIGIAFALIDGKDVLHRRYEGAVGLGRDHPLLLEMRLEEVLASVRPCWG